MDENTQTIEQQVLALAQEVIMRGMLQGQMSPTNPQHQIIVTGAMVIIACANEGMSVEDAIGRIAGIDFSTGQRVSTNDKPDTGHPGQYL